MILMRFVTDARDEGRELKLDLNDHKTETERLHEYRFASEVSLERVRHERSPPQ